MEYTVFKMFDLKGTDKVQSNPSETKSGLEVVNQANAPFVCKPLPLGLVLHEVFEKSEPLAAQKGIKLCFELSKDRMLINCDNAALSPLVLLNVVHNAVKYSEPGGRIALKAYPLDDTAVIEVQDYGIGIPEALLSEIFVLNANGLRPGTLGEGGAGYGLLLVQEYLQLMKGSIEIDSREAHLRHLPRGTKVTIKIPLASSKTAQP